MRGMDESRCLQPGMTQPAAVNQSIAQSAQEERGGYLRGFRDTGDCDVRWRVKWFMADRVDARCQLRSIL